MKNKKKAFTLTELLVVVIVIGVLSAAVLPKFSKVIETRKTTEAEELMSSIRTEQEKRCALDKPYLTDLSQMNDVIKTASTKNYQINLQDKGINAASKGNYSYTLQMPSYADGRICCDGDDCAKLNKNYPSCQGFTYEPSPDSCAGTVTEPSTPTPCEMDPTSCECNPNQAKCCAAGEVWQDGKCVPEEPVPSGCSDEHTEGELTTKLTLSGGILSRSVVSDPSDKSFIIDSGDGFVANQCPIGQCATTSYYWHCGADTEYKWEKQEKTNCEARPSDTKPCENKGNKIASGNMTATYTCTSSGWSQSGWDSSACRYTCDASTKPQEDPNKTMKCNYCGKAVVQYECDDTTGNWKEVGGPCSKTKEECGYLCGTAQAECEPGKHDYKSGNQCAPGKGHPGDLVTRYGSNCSLGNGYMCFMKANQSAELATPDGGSSNSNVECECPSAFWSGRYCDERCRWVTERCSTSSSGGGGGGGGGGMRGGCTTSMQVVAFYRDAVGNYYESWGYVTTCEGEM